MIRGARHTDRSPHKSIYAATGRLSPVRSLHRHLEAQLCRLSMLRNETDTGGGEAIPEQGLGSHSTRNTGQALVVHPPSPLNGDEGVELRPHPPHRLASQGPFPVLRADRCERSGGKFNRLLKH